MPKFLQKRTTGPGVIEAETSDGIYVHNGSNYVLKPAARIFLQFTGDPAPTGLAEGDIVIEE